MRNKAVRLCQLCLIFLLFGNDVFAQSIDLNPGLRKVVSEKGKLLKENNTWPGEPAFSSNGFKARGAHEVFSLTVHADFEMQYLYIYNELGQDTIVSPESHTATVPLPEGVYGFITGYYPIASEVVSIAKDSIFVDMSLDIEVFAVEAKYKTQFSLVKETSLPLYISTLTFYFSYKTHRSGLALANTAVGTVPFSLHYNYFPKIFNTEWAAKGKPGVNNDNIYLVNGDLAQQEGDTLIVNDPANYASADFHYHFPDSIAAGGLVSIVTLFPDFNRWGVGDIHYVPPVHIKIYQDTSAAFALQSSTFKQFISALNLLDWSFLITSELRIGENGVNGHFYYDREAISFPVSERSDIVNIGLMPPHWFGKFFNQPDTIKIRAPYGQFHHLFLSQGNDILRHADIRYQIYDDNTLVKFGAFPFWSPVPLIWVGHNPDSLTIPISPGTYKMVITNHSYQLHTKEGVTKVTTGFDLNKADKNPPNIILFQILADNELTSTIYPTTNNAIRFILEEETIFSNVQLFYKSAGDTLWQEISLAFAEPYWQGQIPLLANGLYDLRLLAADNSQNYIDYLMSPGFLVDEATGIHTTNTAQDSIEEITLYPAHPNPFNAQISFPYAIPKHAAQKIEASIFDILGQKIRTIYEGSPAAGRHYMHWDGTNRDGKNVASGIYFFVLKGGKKLIKQKILLVR